MWPFTKKEDKEKKLEAEVKNLKQQLRYTVTKVRNLEKERGEANPLASKTKSKARKPHKNKRPKRVFECKGDFEVEVYFNNKNRGTVGQKSRTTKFTVGRTNLNVIKNKVVDILNRWKADGHAKGNTQYYLIPLSPERGKKYVIRTNGRNKVFKPEDLDFVYMKNLYGKPRPVEPEFIEYPAMVTTNSEIAEEQDKALSELYSQKKLIAI